METFYKAFGALARHTDDPMILAGRNLFHATQIQATCDDVRAKLALSQDDRLLEVGCNVGALLTPLSALVREAVGQDHPDVVARYADFGPMPGNLTLVGGSWPEVRPPGLFDKILIYGVIVTLPDQAAADVVIDACLASLAPGGRLLVGDLCNADMLRRYRSSEEGARISAEYEKKRRDDKIANSATYQGRDDLFATVEKPQEYLDDGYALGLVSRIRKSGMDAWLVPQAPGLPCCFSREDLLVWKRR
jgi:precorrin-6B methylase 2